MKRSIFTGCTALLALLVAGFSLGAGKSDVADAVMKRDAAAVTKLLGQKADVNATQVDGSTALHWAVFNNDVATADLLIRAGANVKAATREGATPLAMASLYGNAPMITRLLTAGADPKAKGLSGETTLMLAARNGNPEAIRVLLKAGVDVNAKETVRGTTALMWAAEQKHPAAVQALLAGGADVAARSAGAGTPRSYMAGKVGTGTVTQIQQRRAAAADGTAVADAGAGQQGLGGAGARGGQGGQAGAAGGNRGGNNNAGNRGGNAAGNRGGGNRGGNNAAGRGGAAGAAPATGAAAAGATDAAPEGDDADDVAVAGLVGGAGGGLTALVFAAREGDLESAKLLVAAKADVNQTTQYGWSPLLTATNNRHYKLAMFLVESGADTNIANRGAWTPLYLATDNRNIEGGDYPVKKPDMDQLEFIKFLLDHKANPNHQITENTLTRTIFTMQWFFEPGATAFVRAAQSGDSALMKLLLSYGADPRIKTNHGDTALTAAGGIGWVEGVTYEHSPETSLEAVRILLDLGLDPNAANQDGRTALMGAAAKGRNEVVQLLVDRGAKLETRDGGSRDTDKATSKLAGHTWQALDYADGLVRVGVQSAVNRPETATLIRKLMTDRGLKVPPPDRVVDSICIVDICKGEVVKPTAK